jgi:G:T-mismatch repair DNA endonuclease (very short patch repair protein)
MKKKKKTSKFRSGLEEKVADLLEGLGITYKYESEKLSYTIEHNYTPDFVLPNYTYLETKGYWDAADRRKVLAVKKANPEIDLRMIFQSPYNKISKKSKTTYAMWCEKHAIPWTSFHNIPLEWLI